MSTAKMLRWTGSVAHGRGRIPCHGAVSPLASGEPAGARPRGRRGVAVGLGGAARPPAARPYRGRHHHPDHGQRCHQENQTDQAEGGGGRLPVQRNRTRDRDPSPDLLVRLYVHDASRRPMSAEPGSMRLCVNPALLNVSPTCLT
jgi:hypothetical protein